jgi:hypothetical protein
MEVANTLVYYDTSTVTVLKSFIVQASRAVYTKLYFLSNLRVGFSVIILSVIMLNVPAVKKVCVIQSK